jgi:uncharacterized protein YdaU (DUF1376 family)
MKSKSPAFQFYPQDFLVGSAMLSAEETGAYIRLLCYSWTHDGLPDDDAQLQRLAGCHGNAIASIRHKFGICQDGKLRNARLEDVRIKQIEYKNAQKANAEKRWQKQQKTNTSMPSHMPRDIPSHMPPHMPSHEIGIPIGICQNDALHSSSSYITIDKSIVVSSTCVEPAPKNEKLIDEDKTPQRKNNVVDEAWIADIKRHYPTIDVDEELRKMDAWIALHPGRRKTRKFIVGWLNRCQTELAPEPQKPALRNEDYDFTW